MKTAHTLGNIYVKCGIYEWWRAEVAAYLMNFDSHSLHSGLFSFLNSKEGICIKK